MNANLMSAIFIGLQKQSNIALSLWVLLSEPPWLSLPALPSLLTLPTYILNQVSTSFITSLHLHHFLFLFSSSSLRLSLLPFKLLICFGCLKWIAHRWPNFSVDFPKLISCCILVWIPNEYCVKIGKSLIRWNGGGKKSPPPPLSILFWLNLPHSPTHSLSCYLLWMDIYCSAYASEDQISNMSHLSVFYFRASGAPGSHECKHEPLHEHKCYGYTKLWTDTHTHTTALHIHKTTCGKQRLRVTVHLTYTLW